MSFNLTFRNLFQNEAFCEAGKCLNFCVQLFHDSTGLRVKIYINYRNEPDTNHRINLIFLFNNRDIKTKKSKKMRGLNDKTHYCNL